MPTPSLFAQLARTARFTRGVPERLMVTRYGAVVLFLRGRAGDDPAPCLWALDTDSGTERLLADPGRLPGASGQRRGVETYAVDRSGDLVAFVLAGALWTVDPRGGEPRLLPARHPVSDPRPDPAGGRIAYLSRGALRVIEADGTGDRPIAEPDGPDVEFGTAEHTAATSPDGPRGHWWSPDGSRLLLARTDSTAVPLLHLSDPADPGAPPRTLRYTTVGTPNPDVSLWLAALDGSRKQVRWDREAFEYVVGAGWDRHGPHAVVQSRDQRTVRLLAIDPAGGGTTVLTEQCDERWVHLVPGLPARTDSGSLLAHADLHGTRHLTLNGTPVTPPGLQLRSVLGTDGDEVLFTASDDPTETHLWTYTTAGGANRLSSAPGVHGGVRRDGTLVHVTGGPDRLGGTVEVRRTGKPPIPVPSYAEQPVLPVRATQLVLGKTELRALLHLPSWYGPGSDPLPVLLDPYGGASNQRVTAKPDARMLVSQWFAEQGFAVLVADGRGTPGRGPDWEREVYGDVLGPVLDDQVTALHEAARLHPELDLTRVGIRGWSFGGSLATLAVLRRPDVFHAAVAGAGVTDQRLYNARWRERFLGPPEEFPDRYDSASLLREAPRLTRPLLLMHGLADTNVLPLHTLRLSEALLTAGRPHEVLLLPGVGHQSMGIAITESLLGHQTAFLRRHLVPESIT